MVYFLDPESFDYPDTMKRCRNCNMVMEWEEQCECLKKIGIQIRRKAREVHVEGQSIQRKKTSKPTKGADDDTGSTTKPTLLF